MRRDQAWVRELVGIGFRLGLGGVGGTLEYALLLLVDREEHRVELLPSSNPPSCRWAEDAHTEASGVRHNHTSWAEKYKERERVMEERGE